MATLTVRTNSLRNPYFGLFQVEAITQYPPQIGLVEVPFNPRLHLRTLDDACCFFYDQLSRCFGYHPNFSFFTWDIAVASYDRIRAQGRGRGLLVSASIPISPTPVFVDETLILGCVGWAVPEYPPVGFDFDRTVPEYPTTGLDIDEGVIFDGVVVGGDGDEVSGGLSEREITLLKKERFVGKDEDRTCSVCLDDFRNGAMVTKLSPCSHEFHNKCIATWLRKNRTCPCCRSRCVV